MKNDFVTVTTLLWDDPTRDQQRNYKFGVEHVLIWRNMIARNLSIPHEFVCITNMMAAANELRKNDIRPVPLDMAKHVPGTVFVRLMLRRPDIGGILGRRVFMTDLDVVITGNIDSIVSRDEDNVLWRNPRFEPGGRRAFYQSSIQLFDAGARSYLYTDFQPGVTDKWINRRFGAAEQAWISERLPWDEAYWDESWGIYGAGRIFDGRPDGGVTSELPANTKIVSCPGQRAPWQEEFMQIHPWAKEHYR